MEAPSHLEEFLRGQSASGLLDSEGKFTLAREQALRKIAEFQLPFRAAWVLKIIQSAVSAEDGAPIQVELSAKEARFIFLGSGISLEDVESEFYNPEPAGSRSLRHLLSALWSIGLKEEWPFELTFPRVGGALIWDGKKLHRTKVKTTETACCLTVSPHNQESSALGWIKTAITRGGFNAEVLKTLVSWCYTSPVPLTVDGRRIDSLYACPTHGPTTKDFPLTIGFGSGDIPPLAIPMGTFETIPKPKDTRKFWTTDSQPSKSGESYRKIGDRAFKKLSPQAEAAVPFLLTLHRTWVKNGKNSFWQDRAEHSRVYWIRDGVVVDKERIKNFRSPCSVAIFLNSEELRTDLTSLRLAKNRKRKQRLALAKAIVARSLSSNLVTLSTSCEESIKDSETKERFVAGGIFLVGLATVWFAPAIGVLFLGMGGWNAKTAGNEQRGAVGGLKMLISDLQKKLKE